MSDETKGRVFDLPADLGKVLAEKLEQQQDNHRQEVDHAMRIAVAQSVLSVLCDLTRSDEEDALYTKAVKTLDRFLAE